jgi:hypothetical protein
VSIDRLFRRKKPDEVVDDDPTYPGLGTGTTTGGTGTGTGTGTTRAGSTAVGRI